MKLGDYDFLLEKIKREEQLTKLCKSKHVIELYQKFESENSYIFEFEYCEGNLFEEILKDFPSLNFMEIEADGKLDDRACVVETAAGTVDASVDAQIAAIEKSIRKNFAK